MGDVVRVRYAPSPTGEPHLGNIRTALFNWLFARSRGGQFILRIEDTDRARLEPGATDAIFEALEWLNIDWDEGPRGGGSYGPYIQSERLDLYQDHAKWLVDQGNAYYCYCTPDRLDKMRRDQTDRKQPPGYDRRCRDLTRSDREQASVGLGEIGREPVVRFKMPTSGLSTIQDLIRGDVQFDLALLDDFVLLKSDGYPTYHLASVVDDHLMEISHVLRAEEWLSSAPRHQELYRALGYSMPKLAHLPVILGKDRSKLSKRHGATSILAYRDNGYLSEAVINFLVLLGWSLDDHTETFSRTDLLALFTLDRVASSPAVFNVEKLDWFNGVYIRNLAIDSFVDHLFHSLQQSLPKKLGNEIDRDYLRRIAPLIQERIRWLSEGPELTSFFFEEQLEFDPNMLLKAAKLDRESVQNIVSVVLKVLEGTSNWDADTLELLMRPLAETLELKTGQIFSVVRVAITGRTAAPPLFDTMAVLGKSRCLTRLQKALDLLHSLI